MATVLEETRLPKPGPDALPLPAHVPPERAVDVRRIALMSGANDALDPFHESDVMRAPGVPRVLYSPYPFLQFEGPGHWLVSHYEDIQRAYEDNETFSTKGVAEFQQLAGETFRSIPLALDPPDHTRYRKFLNPKFTPVALKELEGRVRELVNEMIDEFADKGEVDIAYDFGRVFPVKVFLDLMGLPFAMFEQFLTWEWEILHSRDHARMGAALKGVIAYLREFIAEKKRNPDDKLGSYIANGTIDGQPLTDDEILGMTWFLWLGGLDTVASTIALMFRRLALDTTLQAQLRENPELTNSAVEEFLRTQPLVNSYRLLKKDLEWDGVTMKQGDWICLLNTSGNFDPEQFAEPRKFDPARQGNRHFTFVGGVHICLGAHLARRELRILLDEFLRRIPEFRAKPGADTTACPGLMSIRNLPIVWDVA